MGVFLQPRLFSVYLVFYLERVHTQESLYQ